MVHHSESRSAGSKALHFALLVFLGGGDPWLFSVEDSSYSSISRISGSLCLLQEDALRQSDLTTSASRRWNCSPSPG